MFSGVRGKSPQRITHTALAILLIFPYGNKYLMFRGRQAESKPYSTRGGESRAVKMEILTISQRSTEIFR